MKKPIKILSLVLAIGLLAACSGNNDKSNQNSSEPSTSEQTSQTSDAGKSSSQQSSKPSSSAQASIPAPAEGEFAFDETKLNDPQPIHTADQKKYLNLNKEYYHITESDLTSCNAMGNSNKSTPNQVEVAWNFTAPAGKTVSKYVFTYGQKADLSDGYELNCGITMKKKFYNPYLGDNYFKVVATLSDGSTVTSPIKIFKVEDQAPRNISAGNMPNVRDMGGRTTYAGGKIKQGLIYRGAGNRFDNNSQVNSECTNVLTKQLKIKTEINVANKDSNNLNINGVTLKNCYMNYGSTPYSNLARNAEKIRQVMDILADETNYPVFYHCRIGTDRTGITGMMIGGLLGIPFNEVFQDYCFSNFAPIDGQRYPNKPSDPNGDDPAKYIDEILAMPGATYQEQTYNALLSIGCKAETLNKIIDFMTEGNKADLGIKGAVKTADQLTSDGTKKTDNKYYNPATYYECGSGKKASMSSTFTAGEKDIVVYLGSTDSSSSSKFADKIALKIDGVEKTIANTKTMHTAGFGRTAADQGDVRTGYMFNILGKYELSAGEHTIEVSVKSGTFNIGTIAAFDHITPSK